MSGEDLKEKQKKAGNPLFILIIFIVLIGFVFFVPEIYKKYNSEISEFLGIGSKKDDEKPNTEEPYISPVSAYYQIGGNPTFKYNELNITKVSLNEGKMYLTISVDETFNLDSAGYYVEFFRNKETFLGRRSLLGKITKSLPVVLDVSNMNIDTTTYFVISHIEDTSIIDNMEVLPDESGITTFTCQKGNTSYAYDFYLRKLIKVSKKISVSNLDLEEYATELIKYQKLEKEYNEYTSVTASIVDNNSSFLFLAEFDYGTIANFSRINDSYLYEKNALDYLIKFKMEAEGFDCR